MRKFFVLMLSVVFVVGFLGCGGGSEKVTLSFVLGEKTYSINGETAEMPGELKRIGGKFYVPHKAIPDALSCASKWVWNDNKKREIKITDHTDYYFMVEDENMARKGDTQFQLDKYDSKAHPMKIDDLLYVPIRATAEILGLREYHISGDKNVRLVFDKPTDDRENYYERKVRLTVKPSNIEVDDVPIDMESNYLDINGMKYLPIEDVLSAFGFHTSHEGADKLVFYRWNFGDSKKEKVEAGHYLMGKNHFVTDGKQIELPTNSIMKDGKMYVTPSGFYKINSMTNIHWSASDVRLWMWVPKDSKTSRDQ